MRAILFGLALGALYTSTLVQASMTTLHVTCSQKRECPQINPRNIHVMQIALNETAKAFLNVKFDRSQPILCALQNDSTVSTCAKLGLGGYYPPETVATYLQALENANCPCGSVYAGSTSALLEVLSVRGTDHAQARPGDVTLLPSGCIPIGAAHDSGLSGYTCPQRARPPPCLALSTCPIGSLTWVAPILNLWNETAAMAVDMIRAVNLITLDGYPPAVGKVYYDDLGNGRFPLAVTNFSGNWNMSQDDFRRGMAYLAGYCYESMPYNINGSLTDSSGMPVASYSISLLTT